MLYTMFYAMYVYKYIFFTFHIFKWHLMGPGLTEASEVAASVLLHNVFSQGCPPR